MRVSNRHDARCLWCALALIAACTSAELRAQPASETFESDRSNSGTLHEELARMDSILFDASFVICDPHLANSIFTDDVEFYHDQTGFQSSEETRENTRRLAESCPAKGITRTLVEGTMHVYPIRDYGAVQTGIHRFEERGTSTSTVATFVHLWRKQDGTWRLARVLSFDHRSEAVDSHVGGEE